MLRKMERVSSSQERTEWGKKRYKSKKRVFNEVVFAIAMRSQKLELSLKSSAGRSLNTKPIKTET